MSSAANYFPPRSGPLATLTRPVATLHLNPTALAERTGVQFLPGYDDLDFLDWAEVTGRLGRYALVYHRNAPNPSTEVVIGSQSRNPRGELLDALEAFAAGSRQGKATRRLPRGVDKTVTARQDARESNR
jgi:hypothetical protein